MEEDTPVARQALADALSGVWEGASQPWDSAREETWWTPCRMVFVRESAGFGAGGEEEEVRIEGEGVSVWAGKEIGFSLRGSLSLPSLRVELFKTHRGAYTNTVPYDGVVDARGLVLDGRWRKGTLTLVRSDPPAPPAEPRARFRRSRAEETVDQSVAGVLAGRWAGSSGRVAGSGADRTEWRACDLRFTLLRPDLGKVCGGGESLWRGQAVPFVVDGLFSVVRGRGLLSKVHTGAHSNRTRYAVSVDADGPRITGEAAGGGITVALHKVVAGRVGGGDDEGGEGGAAGAEAEAEAEAEVEAEAEARAEVKAPDAAAAAAEAEPAAAPPPPPQRVASAPEPGPASQAPLGRLERYRLFLGAMVLSPALSARQLEAIKAARREGGVSAAEHAETLRALGMTEEEFARLEASGGDAAEASGDGGGDDEDANLCKICFDRPINCVLLPCGHLSICHTCSKSLSKCPVCRTGIAVAKLVYRS